MAPKASGGVYGEADGAAVLNVGSYGPMSGADGTQLRGWESREENDGFAFEGTLVIYVRAEKVLALTDHFGVAHVRGANDID